MPDAPDALLRSGYLAGVAVRQADAPSEYPPSESWRQQRNALSVRLLEELGLSSREAGQILDAYDAGYTARQHR